MLDLKLIREDPDAVRGALSRRGGSYPIDAVYLYRYDNKQWVRASGLLPTR